MTFSLVALWVAVKKGRSKDKINKGEKVSDRGKKCVHAAEFEGGLCTTDTFYSFSASVESRWKTRRLLVFFQLFTEQVEQKE